MKVLFCFLLLFAFFGDPIEKNLHEAIEKASDTATLQALYKALGDHYKMIGEKEKAQQAYDRMLSLEPTKSLDERLLEIQHLAHDDKIDQAIEALRKLIADHPHFLRAHLDLALYLGWTHNYSEALQEIDHVLSIEPNSHEALLIKANLMRWDKKPEHAIEIYQKILEQKEDFQARLGIAWAYLDLDKLEEANHQFQQLKLKDAAEQSEYQQLASALTARMQEAKTTPLPLSAHEQSIQEAISLAHQKQYDQALNAIDALLVKSPNDLEALLAKATILRWSTRFQESIALYFEILKHREIFEARLGLAWDYWDLGKPDDAKLAFELLSPSSPSEKKQVDELAASLQRAPQIAEETCASIQEKLATTKKPADRSPLEKKWGICLAMQGKEQEATAVFEEALNEPYGHFSLDDRLEMIEYMATHNGVTQAIAQLKKVLTLWPNNLQAQILYARYLSWNKQFDEGLRVVDAILTKERHNTEALLIKANILRWSHRPQEALPLYLEVLAQGEDFDARLGLAWDYVNLEQFDKADENAALLHPLLAEQIKEKKALLAGIESEKIEAPKRRIQKEIAKALEYVAHKNFYLALTKMYALLCENPCNIDVQVMISKILSWAGRYSEALVWANYVLEQDPSNVEAWIVEGNVLLWKIAPGSFWMYDQALCIDPKSFYAGVGLAYALAGRAAGNSALEIACCLEPSEGECTDFQTLYDALPWGPIFDFHFFRYIDSDHLDTRKYSAAVRGYICDWQADLLCRYAHDTQPTYITTHPTLLETSQSVQIELTRSVNPYLDVGGGIGYSNIRDDSRGDYTIGNLNTNIYTDCGNFALGSAYDVYAETAAALFFKIRTWSNYVLYINYLSGDTTVGGNYFYVKYSDANHSNRVGLWWKEKLFDRTFQVYAKYDIIYMNFESQPLTIFSSPSIFSGGHGYFDPKNYLANQLMLFWIYNAKNIYGTAYPFLGYVTYELLGLHYNGIYYGGGITGGLKFTRHLQGEITGETARYPLTHHLNYFYHSVAVWVKLAF